MSIKDNLDSPPLQALSGFTVLALTGHDAESFANAQFMNDVRPLEPGQWQWNGWLNAKGRIIALFALLRVEPSLLWLILPDSDAGALAAQLQRFVFRSKVMMSPLSKVVVASGWPEHASPGELGDRAIGAPDDSLALDWGTPDRPRRLWLLPAGDARLGPADASNDARWRDFDIAHGLPRLVGTQVEAWTPQMLSLQRLSAYSVKKGCYPGQEIVARTHFLGQAKRGLARLEGEGLLEGLSLTATAQAAGTVVTASTDGRSALAVTPLPSPDVFDSPRAHVLPLLDGLVGSR